MAIGGRGEFLGEDSENIRDSLYEIRREITVPIRGFRSVMNGLRGMPTRIGVTNRTYFSYLPTMMVDTMVSRVEIEVMADENPSESVQVNSFLGIVGIDGGIQRMSGTYALSESIGGSVLTVFDLRYLNKASVMSLVLL